MSVMALWRTCETAGSSAEHNACAYMPQPSYSNDAQRVLTVGPAVAQSSDPHPCHSPSAHLPLTHVANLGLQLDNVLLATDGEGRACVKVCDFGYSKSQSECNTRCGTPEYMAPEVTTFCCRVLT